ncbi:glycosyltransferase involved in cell wall biosynthesis [Prosthecobacter fusiformis]|uniref:Glycosyltransferase involved in cell wall biosynthesis n=1 Tax=Prosthecobacter fusiformis TaxID=48464 RepID=A0A4R7RNL9_9BACT|nr:glycosyltransferase family 2 protein [Prosthecobacter fusiformis]TDU64644.1 glycosyltransferase involved in cell wall biosynthesis [Prosthecobacter fusiformis]
MMGLPVSVCIPVKNEEVNLAACLAALAEFDEVVVVDSGSKDATVRLAREAGATVLQFEWNGKFPKKRNWALQNHRFKHPWILFLDADERMNPSFVAELKDTLRNTTHVGFWITFNNWFMGVPLRHGDVFHKLSLFKVGAGEYERFEEDSWCHLDMEVHEHPVLDGTTGEMKVRLEHQDYRGLKHYLSRHNEYSSWEANRYLWLQSAGEDEWKNLTGRQRFKYQCLGRWWLAWLYWGISLWAMRGFLDGRLGFRFAELKRRYFQEIRLKIMEAKRTGKPA